MEQKEMTEKDAWIAMANGECVQTLSYVHRIREGNLEFWASTGWRPTSYLNFSPYSIVPDPSKPEVDEYKADGKIVANQIAHAKNSVNSYGDQAIVSAMEYLFNFLNNNFQRKGI